MLRIQEAQRPTPRPASTIALTLVLPAVLLPVAIQATAAAAVQSTDPADVVRRMQAFYNQTKDLKSKFKQVYTDKLYDRKRVSYGYLFVRKPGMMRWNYAWPEKKAFIADGKRLWVWEPTAKQAFRNPLSTDTLSTGLTFLLGTGDLRQEFDIRLFDHKSSVVQVGSAGSKTATIKLLPKRKTAQYEHLLLVVRLSDYVVTESVVVSQHSSNHFVFSAIRANTRLSRKRFVFSPPRGTRVIDGSQLQQ